jgi:hypothetical protein
VTATRVELTEKGRIKTSASKGFQQAWGHDQFVRSQELAKNCLVARATWEGLRLDSKSGKSKTRDNDERDVTIAKQQENLYSQRLRIETLTELLMLGQRGLPTPPNTSYRLGENVVESKHPYLAARTQAIWKVEFQGTLRIAIYFDKRSELAPGDELILFKSRPVHGDAGWQDVSNIHCSFNSETLWPGTGTKKMLLLDTEDGSFYAGLSAQGGGGDKPWGFKMHAYAGMSSGEHEATRALRQLKKLWKEKQVAMKQEMATQQANMDREDAARQAQINDLQGQVNATQEDFQAAREAWEDEKQEAYVQSLRDLEQARLEAIEEERIRSRKARVITIQLQDEARNASTDDLVKKIASIQEGAESDKCVKQLLREESLKMEAKLKEENQLPQEVIAQTVEHMEEMIQLQVKLLKGAHELWDRDQQIDSLTEQVQALERDNEELRVEAAKAMKTAREKVAAETKLEREELDARIASEERARHTLNKERWKLGILTTEANMSRQREREARVEVLKAQIHEEMSLRELMASGKMMYAEYKHCKKDAEKMHKVLSEQITDLENDKELLYMDCDRFKKDAAKAPKLEEKIQKLEHKLHKMTSKKIKNTDVTIGDDQRELVLEHGKEENARLEQELALRTKEMAEERTLAEEERENAKLAKVGARAIARIRQTVK